MTGWDTLGAPGWFRRAMAVEPEQATTEVEGCSIAYLAWGPVAAPPVVLVHGGAAHARWWSALAPLLAHDRRVLALDLSGHGHSGWRGQYRAEQWAREVLAVARAGGDDGHRPVVVGHSMGGFVTIVAAANHGAQLEGAVVVDAPVRRADPESEEGRGGRMFHAPKTYPDLATAVEHFHLVPPQPCDNPWLLDEVARDSLMPVEGGWTWRFDPEMFTSRTGASQVSEIAAQLARVACRVAVINGERSAIVDDDVRTYMAELLAGSPAAAAGVPILAVPEAHHHVPLDQPLALVTALRTLLAVWRPIGRPPHDVPRD